MKCRIKFGHIIVINSLQSENPIPIQRAFNETLTISIQ